MAASQALSSQALSPEHQRLAEADQGQKPWRAWGPYLGPPSAPTCSMSSTRKSKAAPAGRRSSPTMPRWHAWLERQPQIDEIQPLETDQNADACSL